MVRLGFILRGGGIIRQHVGKLAKGVACRGETRVERRSPGTRSLTTVEHEVSQSLSTHEIGEVGRA